MKLAYARCLSAMGQHDEAITEVDRLIEQEPKMLEAAQTLARILAAGGQSKAAQAQWSPPRTVVAQHLGRARRRSRPHVALPTQSGSH